MPQSRLGEDQIASFLQPQDDEQALSDDQALRAELMAAGLDMEQAGALQDRYSPVRIRRQLAWLPYREAKHPAGLLIAAIKDDYEAPHTLRHGIATTNTEATGQDEATSQNKAE